MSRGLLLAVLVVGVLTLAGCQGVSSEAFQYSFNQPLRLDGDRTVGQTFRVRSGAVAGVDVLTATFDERPSGVLLVELRDEPGGSARASAEVSADEVVDSQWASARFDDPVEVGGSATVQLQWRGEGPVAVWANAPLDDPTDDDLANDAYLGGQLLVDGEPAAGDLTFRVVGAGGVGAQLSLVADVARQGLGRLGRAPGFALGWLLLLAGSGALAVWGLASPARRLAQGRPHDQGREDEEGAAP